MEDGTAHTEHCILCNRIISRSFHTSPDSQLHNSFLGSFRVVFTTPESGWKDAHLSDTAPYSDWKVGIPGYTSAHNKPTHYWREYVDPARWRVARNFAFFKNYGRDWNLSNIVWVFPFHSECWQTLEMAAKTLDVRLDTQAVHDVAMTFHFEDTIRNLHSMAVIREESLNQDAMDLLGLYSERSRSRSLRDRSAQNSTTTAALSSKRASRDKVHASFDAFTVSRDGNWERSPTAPQTFQDTLQARIARVLSTTPPVGRGVLAKGDPTKAQNWNDPFGSLPPEILEAISSQLPLADLRSLRMASHSCLAVTFSASFFRTALRPRGPLGYVLELTDLNREANWSGWSTVFAQAVRLSKLPDLDYRKPTWSAAIDLMDLVRLRLDAPLCLGSQGHHKLLTKYPPPRRSTKYTKNSLGPPRPEWVKEVPDEDPWTTGSENGRWLEIGKPLERAFASTMRLHERQFVTGLSFHYEDGTSSQIGYIHPSSTTTAWTHSDAGTRKINYMTVTVDAMGVRGISIGSRGPRVWVGDEEGFGIERRRLRLRDCAARDGSRYAGRFIEAYFDNLKMQHIL